MAEIIPAVGHIYFNNDTNEQVVVFYAKNNEVRYAPALINTGQEFKSTWLEFLANHERAVEHLDAAAFTSEADIEVEEGAALAHDLVADETSTFAITGGADAALFEIVVDVLDFVGGVAPPFDTPEDADEDNVYELEVTATDDDDNETIQVMTVTVTDAP